MKLPFNIGLKLFSTNSSIIPEAKNLQAKNLFDYIELYAVPGSYSDSINAWKGFDTNFIIHASHSGHGTNFARADKRETNQINFNEARLFADSLHSSIIIVHGGSNGSFDETINQLTMLNDDRIALENKPKISIYNDEICVGYSPSEFQRAADAGVLSGTVLDFGHAVYAANSLNIDVMEIIQDFSKFDPKVFHISDGDSSSVKDSHFNLGKGDFDLEWLLSVIPKGSFLTIETPRRTSNGLEDFETDVNFLANIMVQNNRISRKN